MAINIPPVEYCSITRAAEMFNFSVEDILHLHVIGLINIKILLVGNVGSPEFETSLIYIDGATRCTVSSVGADLGTSPKTSTIKEQSLRPDGITRRVILNGLDGGDEPEHLTPEVSFFIMPGKPLYSGLYGFFDVGISDKDVIAYRCSGGFTGHMQIGILNDFNRLSMLISCKENMLPFFCVTYADLCKIKMAQNNDYTTIQNKDNHHVTEFSSTIRELVLSAAIYAKDKWPERCNNSTLWAQTVTEEALALFGSKNAPLSLDLITRILSSAIKRGRPYRR
ncbi:hypothetical protein [Aeromonas jandaei]|uniref:hypothetical protein n=1 Tax=Aeromonas jandaei TaxID=650 RepID=UPI001ADD834F|nr:hypothetical protein [Aeromonas jandaei]QTL95321.1 hypothetical protein AjGTCBM29_03230 [Aeromonas jandaei]